MSAPLDVVRRNIDAWNKGDIEARLSTLHFPQYRFTRAGELIEESEEVISEKWRKGIMFNVKYDKWDH